MLKHIIENSNFSTPSPANPKIVGTRPLAMTFMALGTTEASAKKKNIPGLKCCCLWCLGGVLLCPKLVVSILGDVPDPRECLVTTLLNDL